MKGMYDLCRDGLTYLIVQFDFSSRSTKFAADAHISLCEKLEIFARDFRVMEPTRSAQFITLLLDFCNLLLLLDNRII